MIPSHARLLRGALLGNAAFSGVCAVLLVAGPGAVATWLGLPPSPLLLGLGLGLLAFAGLLVVLATRPRPPRSWVLAVIGADAAWVVGTVILLLSPGAGAFSGRGIWTMLLVAVNVAAWGLLQAAGARARGLLSGVGAVTRRVRRRNPRRRSDDDRASPDPTRLNQGGPMEKASRKAFFPLPLVPSTAFPGPDPGDPI